MNRLAGHTFANAEEHGNTLSAEAERGLAETLTNLREVSDALWQTTATLGITINTILEIDEVLIDLQTHAKSLAANKSEKSIGIGYASRLAALVKQASFQHVNLLTQNAHMDALTQTKVENGVRSMVFQTIPPSNLSLDNGPFRLRRHPENNTVRIEVLKSHNATAAFGELESISICFKKDGGPRRTAASNIKWTRNPKYICAVLNASIRCAHSDIGDIPVSFDGSTIMIGPAENITIEAICLQGPYVGALGHIKTLLSNETCTVDAILAAVDLALLATEESRKTYKEAMNEVGKMEAITLTFMERIALMTVMPQSLVAESAALIATNTAQLLGSGDYSIAESSTDILQLMLKDEPAKMI